MSDMAEQATSEVPLACQKKFTFTLEDARRVLKANYGIADAEVVELSSYDDRNYRVKTVTSNGKQCYVLKITNSSDSSNVQLFEAQNALLLELHKQNFNCSVPIQNKNGDYYSLQRIENNNHIVRLLMFVEGEIFKDVAPTDALLYQSGQYLAKLDQALAQFEHKGYEKRDFEWMLSAAPKLLNGGNAKKLQQIEAKMGKAQIDHARQAIEWFEQNVLRVITDAEQQLIHGDYNEQNIVVGLTGETYQVTGVIDFGDTHKAPLLYEIGIAAAYMILQAKSVEKAGIFLAGYAAVQQINDEQYSKLKYCVSARLAQSLLNGLITHEANPDNKYVLSSQAAGWKCLKELVQKINEIEQIWQTTAEKYLEKAQMP